jgi:hypothetical protein
VTRRYGSLAIGLRRVPIYVYAEADEFVATYDDPIPINAFGTTPGDAIARLRVEIVEHLDWLEQAGDALSPLLVRQRERLRLIVGTGDY